MFSLFVFGISQAQMLAQVFECCGNSLAAAADREGLDGLAFRTCTHSLREVETQ